MTVEALRKLIDGAQRWHEEPVRDVSPHFAVHTVADLMGVEPQAPLYWWHGFVPAGVVTLLGAHGGVGKSFFALMLCVHVALGLPLFGITTRRGIAAFFSGEDSASLIRYRLHWICRVLGVNVADLTGRLFIIDATEGDPALFHEVSIGGRRQGLSTPTYGALREFVADHAIDVLVVDNASDTFDASEIDRSRVRGFMRALAHIAQDRAGAVLLLSHVDKGTSRGDRAGTEAYSGSTAWHNSARSRMYLTRDKDATLLLEHQKANHGRLCEPLHLVWPEGGIMQVDAPIGGFVQHIANGGDTKALLRLLHESYARGEYVATDTRSRYHVVKVLGDEATFPKRRKPAEVFQMLREAEKRGTVQRETYKDRYRRSVERWQVTSSGMESIGLAASAASAASIDVAGLAHIVHAAAASAASAVQGVWGNSCAHEP